MSYFLETEFHIKPHYNNLPAHLAHQLAALPSLAAPRQRARLPQPPPPAPVNHCFRFVGIYILIYVVDSL
jgi:hypothetical protein